MKQHDRWEGHSSNKISRYLTTVYSERRQQPTLPGWLLLTGTLERCSATVTRKIVRRRRGQGPTLTAPHPTTTDPPPSRRYCQCELLDVESRHFCGHVDMLSMPGWNVIGPRGYLFSKSIRTITIHQTPNIWNISFQTASVLSQKMNGGPVHC